MDDVLDEIIRVVRLYHVMARLGKLLMFMLRQRGARRARKYKQPSSYSAIALLTTSAHGKRVHASRQSTLAYVVESCAEILISFSSHRRPFRRLPALPWRQYPCRPEILDNDYDIYITLKAIRVSIKKEKLHLKSIAVADSASSGDEKGKKGERSLEDGENMSSA